MEKDKNSKTERSAQHRYGRRRPIGADTSDIRDLWTDGEMLADAWFSFADEYEREKWRESFEEGPRFAHTLLIQSNLLANLRDGQLLAIGIRESAEVYGGPEIIPGELFAAGMESVKSIFSDTSRLVLAGRAWVQVTVTERKWIPPATLENRVEPPIIEKASKQMGRPSKSIDIQEILREMVENGLDLESANQKRVCEEVRSQAKKRQLLIANGFSDPVIKNNLRLIRNEFRTRRG